ncbi:hypothetical protein [Streptomyces sp. ITFR-6]|uniref:hypothetical protein n=1 Tax=Streptomyces sp. ITFR-6 TaxID=3075197 RepID=UPI00288AB41F|nr:hypothetical protein [Streptomyces sp. ITFR-6]WNI27477.1 hypothetical protein RLT59_00780 [Streptomyces sp. ITFR-6]
MRRAVCGPTRVSVTANDPVTRPAAAKDPVSAWTSQTTASPAMATPTRAGAAARKKAAAPGVRRAER